jgi:ABC-type sugar transport system ATPase subunit
VAVDDLSFSLGEGEIVGLLGENGAGKSTIIGVLAGLFGQDYAGELALGGVAYRPANVADAERSGIVLIAQDINVVAGLTVAQNLFLNNEPTRWGLVDHLEMRRAAAAILAEFDVDVDASQPMGALDLARQQLVMIIRALHKQARILILDEPTAALTGDEAERLFARLRSYRLRGTTSLFVSHRLAEVFALVDRILVLRDGRLVGDHPTEHASRSLIVNEMLGGTVIERAAPPPSELGATRLRVDHLTALSPTGDRRRLVDDVTFEIAAGEIIGLFGLVGSGAGVVGKAIFGAWPHGVTASIAVDSRPLAIRTPSDAIASGIGFVAQDRRDALVTIHSVAANVSMASLDRFEHGPLLDADAIRATARRQIEQLRMRTSSELAKVNTLSGGNQQKVQVARWLVADTPILILDDPTRGVDVGARAEIHAILTDLAAGGRALLLVSSDASELLAVCARVLVMRGGRLVGDLVGRDTSEAELIELASGLVGDAQQDSQE